MDRVYKCPFLSCARAIDGMARPRAIKNHFILQHHCAYDGVEDWRYLSAPGVQVRMSTVLEYRLAARVWYRRELPEDRVKWLVAQATSFWGSMPPLEDFLRVIFLV